MAKLGEGVCLVCLLGLTSLTFYSPPVSATPDKATCSPVDIPGAGASGSRVLDLHTDAGSLTPPQNGATYANPPAPSDTLFMSSDQGEVWEAVGLMESETASLLDLAPSPDYPDDETLFLLTWDGEHVLWRSLDGSEGWEQVFSSALDGVDSLSLVSTPGDGVVYLAGTSNGNPAIWRSTDNGESFSLHATPAPVDAWAVANKNTLFIAGYDGSHGLIYRTSNGGQSFASPATLGSTPLSDIALSPDYSSDDNILAGASDGRAYWSEDGGGSFEPLPQDSAPPFDGMVSVAFDAYFSRNHTVYAAGDTPGSGIYRFVIGESTGWEEIGGNGDGMFGDLAVSASGVLYAADFRESGGLARSLDAAYSPEPTFEALTEGLEAGSTLTRLWLVGTRLWAMDTANNHLMTISDSLGLPVSLLSPEDGAEAVGAADDEGVNGVTLEWETLGTATEYEWQISDDGDFSEVLFSGHTGFGSRKPADLEPDTTYHWRVRASEPILSPWSEAWSFTTSEVTEETIAAPKLRSPKTGDSGLPLKPLFQWSAVTGATGYELVLSAKKSLADPAMVKSGDSALSGNEWQCSTGLDYETTYYWKVRGINSDTEGNWSVVGDFTTLEEPAPGEEPTPDEAPTPASPESSPAQAAESPPETPVSHPASSTTDWVKYLIVAIVIGAVILSAVMLNRRGKRQAR